MLKKIKNWVLNKLTLLLGENESSQVARFIASAPFVDEEKVTPILIKNLLKEAKNWKSNEPHLAGEELLTKLTLEETSKIEEVSRYPRFIEMISQSKSLLNAFFVWVLRDKNPVEIFVRFPESALALLKSNLSSRIGRIGNDVLKIKKDSLYLMMQGKEIEIVDLEKNVTFANNYKLKIKEIYEVFERKNTEAGTLEFMKEGIINWSPLHLGTWDPKTCSWLQIDVTKNNWIEDLPLFETMTLNKLQERYGISPKSGEWVVAASATRGQRNLDFNGTHAFLEMAIPLSNGEYALYDFGKVAKEYPKNLAETLRMLCQNSLATISYPDENVFYTHRQTGYTPFIVTKKEGEEILEWIKKDIIESRRGNRVYQIESENCAKWVHSILEEVLGKYTLPSLFWMPLLETESRSFLGRIFSLIRLLPKPLHKPSMFIGHLLFGAFQITFVEEEGVLVEKSLANHEFLQHGYVYLPALMIQKLDENSLYREYERRRVYFARTRKNIILCYKQLKDLFSKMYVLNFNLFIRGVWPIYAIRFANLERGSPQAIISS